MSTATFAIESTLGLLAFWLFTFYFWRPYRLAAFRDHVFSLRDRLFLCAASGAVRFDDPAYTMLRFRMNVVLRYAHEFTLARLAVALFSESRTPSLDKLNWERSLESLAPEVRSQLRHFDETLAVAILHLAIFRSFFLYLLLRPVMQFVKKPERIERIPSVVIGVEKLERGALEEEERRDCDEPVFV